MLKRQMKTFLHSTEIDALKDNNNSPYDSI